MSDEQKTKDNNKHEVDIEVNVTRDVQPQKVEFDETGEREKIRKEEVKRVSEINEIGRKHDMQELAQEYIQKGASPSEFGMAVLEKKGEVQKVDEKKGDLGLSDNEKRDFSFVRAIRALHAAKNGEHDAWKRYAPYEKEISDSYAKNLGKDASGIFIPREIAHFRDTRDLTVGTATAGGNLVATELLAQSFIDILRNRMVTRQLGATVLGGLQGNIAIPRQTGAATAYWVTEGNAPTESQQAFDQVTMSPKTVGAFTDISRKLIIQSSKDVEMLVKNDLARVLAIELDRVGLNGSGSGAEPTGILNTSGIATVGTTSAHDPSYAYVIEHWSDIAVENADYGSLGYVTNPLVCAKLMQTYTNATYGENPVWRGGPSDGTMIGYKALVTNQMPSDGGTTGDPLSSMIFGNWNDLIIGEWSGMDLTIDPYTHSTSGTLRIVILMDADIAVRHAESFSIDEYLSTN